MTTQPLHDAAAVGFELRAAAYQEARPIYHPDLVARFVERFGAAPVLDLGAGTGKFTGQLVAAGLKPVAVEPVTSMREKLTESLPDVETHAGSAEAIPVADDSIATVVVAQAFHWFRHTAALDEIARVLKPNGSLVTVWNVRDNSDRLVRAYSDIVNRHAGDTPRHHTMIWRTAIENDPRFELADDYAIANPWPTTVEGVVQRALSTSFIGALDEAVQDELVHDLRVAIEPFGPDIEYAYRSELQAWRFSESAASRTRRGLGNCERA